jgi:hypothetical protein
VNRGQKDTLIDVAAAGDFSEKKTQILRLRYASPSMKVIAGPALI